MAAVPNQPQARKVKMATEDPTTLDWSPMGARRKLKENQLERPCNDMFWAIAFVVALLSVIGFAIYGALMIKGESSASSADPEATIGDPDDISALVWKVVLQMSLASAFGVVFAMIWVCILRSCAGCMIKTSIFVYLGLQVAMMVTLCCLLPLEGSVFIILIVFGLLLVLHMLYFWCVWHRIPMAEATLAIAVKIAQRYSSVFWISVLFSLVTIAYIFACAFGWIGLTKLTGMEYNMNDMLLGRRGEYIGEDGITDGPGWYGMIISGSVFVVFLWGVITMGYIVHAICAGVMGTWYFGTSRKRTVTDALIRALTVNLGSIAYAAFIVAIVRTLELMARAKRDDRDAHAAIRIIAAIVVCILAIIGDILQYFGSVALVRVAVYGETFCTAAKRTMNMFAYRNGMKQIINDDLSSMPIGLGCLIIYFITVPCMFASYHFLGPILIIVPDAGTGTMAVLSFAFSLCAMFIPVAVLNTLPSFVQALYVLWSDNPAALDSTHPTEAAMLKAAALKCYGYRVVYDDHRITGRA